MTPRLIKVSYGSPRHLPIQFNYCGLKLKSVKHNAYVATWIIKKSIAEIILFWKQSEEPVVSRKRRALESDDCNCERLRSKFYQMYNADGPNLEKTAFPKGSPLRT